MMMMMNEGVRTEGRLELPLCDCTCGIIVLCMYPWFSLPRHRSHDPTSRRDLLPCGDPHRPKLLDMASRLGLPTRLAVESQRHPHG